MGDRTKAQESSQGEAPNKLESLFRKRDLQREQLKTAQMVVRGAEVPVERNRMGSFRWYLHPDIEDAATRSLLFYVQEIPPGGCSGMQLHQGGRAHYVWAGKGYTWIDGVRHNWDTGDVILLPIKPEGVSHQHFNLDNDRPARLLVVEPSLFDTLGVDLGSGFEQLADAPDDQEG